MPFITLNFPNSVQAILWWFNLETYKEFGYLGCVFTKRPGLWKPQPVSRGRTDGYELQTAKVISIEILAISIKW